MLKERCSRLPLVTLCGAAIDQSFSVQGTADYARLGTAVHAVMASWIIDSFDVEVVPRIAGENHVSLEELRIGVFMAWGQWKHLKEFFPEPQVEVPLEYSDGDLHLTGTCDILSAADIPTLRICDLKSGFLDTDAEQQVRGYAFTALKKFPLAWEVNASVWRPRDNAIEGYTWTREELDDWFTGLKKRLSDTTFRPGRHCAYCGRGPTCEAKTAYLRQSLALVTGDAMTELPAQGHPDRARMLEEILAASRIVEKACERAQDIVRAEVRAAGGELGNLYLQTQQERRIVMPQALPILSEVLGDDLDKILKVGKGAVEDLISERMPKGQKSKACEAVMARLEEVGGLRTAPKETLRIRKAKLKQLEVQNDAATGIPSSAE